MGISSLSRTYMDQDLVIYFIVFAFTNGWKFTSLVYALGVS